MFGYSQAEMVGQPSTMIFVEDLRAAGRDRVRENPDDGNEIGAEYLTRTKQGEVRVVRAVETALTGIDGRPQRASYVADITVHQRRLQTLSHVAAHDALTGLPNRVLFGDRLDHALVAAARRGAPFAVLQIDLDRFKAINDTYGHAAGDVVLCTVPTRMRALLRVSDTVARLGGDEFALLLPEGSKTKARLVANKLRCTIRLPIDLTEHTVTVDASIGVALYPKHGEDSTLLLNRADMAMYVAKAAGGGVVVYEPDQDVERHRPSAGESLPCADCG